MKKKIPLFLLSIGMIHAQKFPNSGVVIEPLQAKQLEITQAADLGQYVEGLDETPEASYNIATATWGIAGAFPPVIWDYHYYDAFYPWYSNDKVTYYDFEGDRGYGGDSTQDSGQTGAGAHQSIAEKGVAKREDIRQKEEEQKRKRR